jgi:hypothetical protein
MTPPMPSGITTSTREHLRILSIAHYVVGALHALFACFGLIHFGMGLFILISPQSMSSADPEGLKIAMGTLFAVLGGLFVLAGWTLGLVTILSGRYIAQRRKRVFSVVVAGINCVFLPFGTVLGIFTLILLTREDVMSDYKS